MPEPLPLPLRRRVRARVLGGAIALGRRAPGGLVEAALRGAGAVARRGRAGATIRENLLLAYGDALDDAARERIARAVLAHVARQARTWLRLSAGAPPEGPERGRGDWIDALVTVDDSVERLDRVLAAGRGALIVTAHLGDWELLCAALRRRGLNGAVVGRVKHRDPLSERWIALRRGYGVETLPQSASPRRILEVLRRGETLGLLCDLEVRRLAGEFVPFFGRPALTMSAPAALARASRLPLVPVRCVRESGGGYRLSVEEPLALDASLSREAAQLDLLTRMNAVFERWIRATPEQWAWHQPRWRTRPGELEAIPLAAR